MGFGSLNEMRSGQHGHSVCLSCAAVCDSDVSGGVTLRLAKIHSAPSQVGVLRFAARLLGRLSRFPLESPMPQRRLTGISCPVCRKLVLALDDDGCMIEGHQMAPCRHYIGMSDGDGLPAMEKGFGDLSRAMELLNEYAYVEDPNWDGLALALAGLVRNPKALAKAIDSNGEVPLDDWLESLPEIAPDGSSWDGGSPGCSGGSNFFFVSVRNQRKLAKRLAGICDAVERLLPPADSTDESD